MHKTQFCNLKFQPADMSPGDYGHTVVIRDTRLPHPEDIQNRAAYQLLLFQLKLHVQKYKVCWMYSATKLTVNDNWIAENPCYFSDNCCFLINVIRKPNVEVHSYV